MREGNSRIVEPGPRRCIFALFYSFIFNFLPKMIDCIYNESKFTMVKRIEGMFLSQTEGFFVSLAYRANSWVTILQYLGMEV